MVGIRDIEIKVLNQKVRELQFSLNTILSLIDKRDPELAIQCEEIVETIKTIPANQLCKAGVDIKINNLLKKENEMTLTDKERAELYSAEAGRAEVTVTGLLELMKQISTDLGGTGFDFFDELGNISDKELTLARVNKEAAEFAQSYKLALEEKRG